jgi:outer membrane protein assembly factor BamA
MTWTAVLLVALLTTAGQPAETLAAIQVQGNTLTPDEEVRRLAGLDIGMPIVATTIDEVAARLRATRRFKDVDVQKRFASIADASQIVLVIVVDEGPVRIDMTGNSGEATRVVRKRGPSLMFLPVLNGEDGYGLTYGVRFALLNPVGKESRVAFPLTWGGTKEAAAELDKTLGAGRLTRVSGGASLSRRENPFFERDDDRARVWARGERQIAKLVRVGATAGVQRVAFDGTTDHFTQAGADVVLDTRIDPVLPRNAVYARAGWDLFRFSKPTDRVPGIDTARATLRRTEFDARGYLGLFGQNILALRALRVDGDRPIPRYLQPLLGGMENLRGFKAGTAAGDTLLVMSAEVLVPLTSPLSVGKVGVNVFTDRGTVYQDGQRFSDQTLRQGYGAGLWFTAAFLRLNLAVAHGRGASTRFHAGGTVSF